MTGNTLNDDGIISRQLGGLTGIVWAPLLHASWGHLFANTLPFLIFGFLAMAGGFRQFLLVTALIWVISGVGVWLTGPDMTSTIGASGIIFGWLVFLLARGFFARSGRQILLAWCCSSSGAASSSAYCPARSACPGRRTCSARSAVCSPRAGGLGRPTGEQALAHRLGSPAWPPTSTLR
ncbi:hypothetical protein BJF78_18225 [Pseudonocardia sp. CNS-139]|nr:hypothetical protein BJF78_18225 [Pseudonocardia sp. CNS-139]